MAFNFKPLQYNPFEYSNNVGPPPSGQRYDGWSDVTPNEQQNYDIKGLRSQMNQQRDYSGDQFQSLFDSVNDLQPRVMLVTALLLINKDILTLVLIISMII
jgi:hypothetical protein